MTTDQIIRMYSEFGVARNITDKFFVELFDTHLLRGQKNRKLKKEKSSEESFLEFIKHINYNLLVQMYSDVEHVFANIKHNKNFKRFSLRGIKKAETETGLIALAHSLKKLAA